jgi:hypothetical protein
LFIKSWLQYEISDTVCARGNAVKHVQNSWIETAAAEDKTWLYFTQGLRVQRQRAHAPQNRS